jgi:hypothetical protein
MSTIDAWQALCHSWHKTWNIFRSCDLILSTWTTHCLPQAYWRVESMVWDWYHGRTRYWTSCPEEWHWIREISMDSMQLPISFPDVESCVLAFHMVIRRNKVSFANHVEHDGTMTHEKCEWIISYPVHLHWARARAYLIKCYIEWIRCREIVENPVKVFHDDDKWASERYDCERRWLIPERKRIIISKMHQQLDCCQCSSGFLGVWQRTNRNYRSHRQLVPVKLMITPMSTRQQICYRSSRLKVFWSRETNNWIVVPWCCLFKVTRSCDVFRKRLLSFSTEAISKELFWSSIIRDLFPPE